MSCDVIPLGADSSYVVEGVKNPATGEFIDDATVTLTLLDAEGVEIAGQSWPTTMTYVVASDGDYQCLISDGIVANDGDTGTAVISIDGDGLQRTLRLPVVFETDDQQSLPWTSRTEIEQLFGVTNTSRWADMENDGDAGDIAGRIQWAVDEATEEAQDRVRRYVDLSLLACAPRPLRMATTRLAGVFLYESRGVKDTSDDEGKHRLSAHRKLADKYFAQVAAGQRVFDASPVDAPAAVKDSDSTSDDFTIDMAT